MCDSNILGCTIVIFWCIFSLPCINPFIHKYYTGNHYFVTLQVSPMFDRSTSSLAKAQVFASDVLLWRTVSFLFVFVVLCDVLRFDACDVCDVVDDVLRSY